MEFDREGGAKAKSPEDHQAYVELEKIVEGYSTNDPAIEKPQNLETDASNFAIPTKSDAMET